MAVEPRARGAAPRVERAGLVEEVRHAREHEKRPLCPEPADRPARLRERLPVGIAHDEQSRRLDAAEPASRVLEPRRTAGNGADAEAVIGRDAQRRRRADAGTGQSERQPREERPLLHPVQHGLEAQRPQVRLGPAVNDDVFTVEPELGDQDASSFGDEPVRETAGLGAVAPAMRIVRSDDERRGVGLRQQQVRAEPLPAVGDLLLPHAVGHDESFTHRACRRKSGVGARRDPDRVGYPWLSMLFPFGRPLLALLVLAVAAGLAAGTGSAASGASSCARVRAEARTGTPEEVAILFITSGVLRQNPGCAYDLVTSGLRKSRTRAVFASGKAVASFPTRKPKKVSLELTPRVRLSDQVGSWITLAAPDRKARTFEIVLLKRNGRWLVDYWARAVGFN